MKKLLSVLILLASAIVVPVPATAEVNVNIGIGIPLPPAIVFHTAPDVVVLPDTDSVYVAPDLEVDLFSGTAGGGVPGKAAGTVHIIITGAGPIITGPPPSILMWTRAGEDTTGIMTGTDTGGIMSGFPTGGSNGTGGAGVMTDTGNGGGCSGALYLKPAPTDHSGR